jgi:2-polyprenyl-3-methyl-5-hydroxy-6-metoxy-1,4-benzoquinol methylase
VECCKFEYLHGVYPAPSPNDDAIEKGACALFEKLKNINLNILGLSEYNHRYFSDLVFPTKNLINNITKYSFVLRWAIADSDNEVSKMTFVDYGGGHGMLSLLAKASGFSTVIHNDIYEQSCEDSFKIGKQIGLNSDHYIPGEITDVIRYCSTNNIIIDVISNYDVIEHIYDVEKFLFYLGEIKSKEFHVLFASGANNANPIIRAKLKKMHRYFEWNDRAYKKGRKPTDTTKALFDLRSEIIRERCSKLSSSEVRKISSLTRGLLLEDIKNVVDEYVSSGTLPRLTLHPTNTCDPFTGNWFEQLLDHKNLIEILKRRDFDAVVYPGFYGVTSQGVKGGVKRIINFLISLSWPKGLYLAPYYCLKAVYKNEGMASCHKALKLGDI